MHANKQYNTLPVIHRTFPVFILLLQLPHTAALVTLMKITFRMILKKRKGTTEVHFFQFC